MATRAVAAQAQQVAKPAAPLPERAQAPKRETRKRAPDGDVDVGVRFGGALGPGTEPDDLNVGA